MYRVIFIVSIVLALLLTARGGFAEVGMGMSPNLINMTLDIGEEHSTNLILYNPYDVSYHAFIKVECKNCDRNISLFGHTLIEIREDVSQFIEVRELNVFLASNTSVQEGRNVFPRVKAPILVSKNIKLNFLGGIPLTVKLPIFGRREVAGTITATSDGLGTNISIAIAWVLALQGISTVSFVISIMAIVLILTLLLRWLLLGSRR